MLMLMLFLINVNVNFMLIKNSKNIKGIRVFENTFLYTAYGDDSTFLF